MVVARLGVASVWPRLTVHNRGESRCTAGCSLFDFTLTGRPVEPLEGRDLGTKRDDPQTLLLFTTMVEIEDLNTWIRPFRRQPIS